MGGGVEGQGGGVANRKPSARCFALREFTSAGSCAAALGSPRWRLGRGAAGEMSRMSVAPEFRVRFRGIPRHSQVLRPDAAAISPSPSSVWASLPRLACRTSVSESAGEPESASEPAAASPAAALKFDVRLGCTPIIVPGP